MNEVEAVRPLRKKTGNATVISYAERKFKQKKERKNTDIFVRSLIPRSREQQDHILMFI